MFKIVRFPSKLKSFFDSLQNQFHFNHFEYFQMLVLLTAFSWGRRNIATLYRHLDGRNQPHRSRFNNFLSVDRCNYATVLQMKAYESDSLPISLKPEQYINGTRDRIYIQERTEQSADLQSIMEFISSDHPDTKVQTTSGETFNYIPTRNFKINRSENRCFSLRLFDTRW